ncbi:branched-chain amino acid aminotransferase [Govanella unica]|uniref:Branched-chain-amino-acid aminotransferase n=1 Tax=Govanella unica TaxID=2975056 RepID=A0A9X3Z849_9PROT|nr:branched-chain amino acid aminotransferase [Govania unica]MDA5194718.1 branched-chain amino acid aminotransferase [Govania unica]
MTSYKIHPAVAEAVRGFSCPASLGFGAVTAPVMYSVEYRNGAWGQGELLPYGDIAVPPGCKGLHFAEQIFEGMKAYRFEGKAPTLFRPRDNWARFVRSAERMCMVTVPEHLFMDGIEAVTGACAPHIPTASGQALYLRPFAFGLDPSYTIKASDNLRFMVIGSPVEAYATAPMRVMIERHDVRAARGGVGVAKTGGNYAASLRSSTLAIAGGYHVSLWLDPETRGNIEELSGMNVFAVIDGVLHTPELNDSILPGITRDSLIRLARHRGYKLVERVMNMEALLGDIRDGRCSEVFACGTAAIVNPIALFGEADGRTVPLPSATPVASELRQALLDIQEGRGSDPFGWIVEVPPLAL